MLRLVLACLLLLGLAAAPAANAAGTIEILRDCADDGVLQGDYSPSDLRKARQNIPTDTDEYTDCRDVLARAGADSIAGSGAGGGTAGGLGGSRASQVDPFSQEGRDVVGAAAAKGAPPPQQIDGRSVILGNAGLAAGAVRNGLPTSLVIVLALLGAAALATATPFVRRRVLGRFGL